MMVVLGIAVWDARDCGGQLDLQNLGAVVFATGNVAFEQGNSWTFEL